MTGKGIYARIAPLYYLLDSPFEYGRYRRLRRLLFADVGGKILDAGVGTGRNMPFYPPGADVIGIDASPQMLGRAEKRKARLGVVAELHRMDVRELDYPDNHFDHVIATFVFCVLDEGDQLPALAELRRVCKPGGEIRILDYVPSRRPSRRLLMRLWAPCVRRLYGAAFDRGTERHIEAARLELVEARFLFEDIIRLLILRPR